MIGAGTAAMVAVGAFGAAELQAEYVRVHVPIRNFSVYEAGGINNSGYVVTDKQLFELHSDPQLDGSIDYSYVPVITGDEWEQLGEGFSSEGGFYQDPVYPTFHGLNENLDLAGHIINQDGHPIPVTIAFNENLTYRFGGSIEYEAGMDPFTGPAGENTTSHSVNRQSLTAINDSGQAVGTASVSYSHGSFGTFVTQAIGTVSVPGGQASISTNLSSARDINNAGLVTGMASSLADGYNPYLYEAGAYIYDINANNGEDDTTFLSGDAFENAHQMEGMDINEKGVVVGVARGGGVEQAFIGGIDANGNSYVSSLGGNATFHNTAAYAINDAGMAVGEADGVGVLFSAGRVIDLNSLVGLTRPADDEIGTWISRATDINNAGQILVEVTNRTFNLDRTGFFVDTTWETLLPSQDMQPGNSSLTALLGEARGGGHYAFDNADSGEWFDPPVAGGYEYTIDNAAVSLFTGVTGFAPGFDGLSIEVFDPEDPNNVNTTITLSITFGEGVNDLTNISFADFAAELGNLLLDDGGDTGVAAFRIVGIDPRVDANNPNAFPVALTFSDQQASFDMLAIDIVNEDPYTFPVPEPATLALLGLGGGGMLLKRRG